LEILSYSFTSINRKHGLHYVIDNTPINASKQIKSTLDELGFNNMDRCFTDDRYPSLYTNYKTE